MSADGQIQPMPDPEPLIERPQAACTPAKSKNGGKSKYIKSVLNDRERLKGEVRRLKKELQAAKQQFRKVQAKLEKQDKSKRVGGKNKKKKEKKKLSQLRKEQVAIFVCRDENSRMLSGKKDFVTKNKVREQRRVLLHSLKDLHSEYSVLAEKPYKLSYRQFVRYCPFYVTPAKESDRNTCACLDHENVKLLIDRLISKGLLATMSISDLLSSIVCDKRRKCCMYRTCPDCCYNEIQFIGPLEEGLVTWQQWSRISTSQDGKTFSNFAKVTQSGTCCDLLALFNKKLDSLAEHQFNWLHQATTFRVLKDSLTENEVCIHVDFSENYGCKLGQEIQAFHFGGSRKQVAIHTCVAYTASASYSYATLSACTRHDERAVWAHMEPVLKDVIRKCNSRPETLHIISDGPANQYRNKKNFYLLSTIPFMSDFRQITWNFSEKSHGKGAPDGVGGALKRIADTAVQRGADIQSPEDLYSFLTEQESSITFYWVSEESFIKYDNSVPVNIPTVRGTLRIHQVMCEEPAVIKWREISCFCARPALCNCHHPNVVDFRHQSAQFLAASANGTEELVGKFVVVRYDNEPFIGQVTKVVNDEIEVSCMQQLGGKNKFIWPHPPDLLFYNESNVLHVISEPEPLTLRYSKLTADNWKDFQQYTSP